MLMKEKLPLLNIFLVSSEHFKSQSNVVNEFKKVFRDSSNINRANANKYHLG